MTWRKRCMALAREIGAHIEDDSPGVPDTNIDAPSGCLWVDGGVSAIHVCNWTDAEPAEQAWRDAYARMLLGTEKEAVR